MNGLEQCRLSEYNQIQSCRAKTPLPDWYLDAQDVYRNRAWEEIAFPFHTIF